MLQLQQINVVINQSVSIDGADFGINEFKKQPLQQIVPFKNSDSKYFAIILYSGSMNEYSTITERNIDQSGYLIFKSPGEVNKVTDYRSTSNGVYIQFTEKFLLRNRQLLSIITGFPFFEISLLRNKALEINARQSATIKEQCPVKTDNNEQYT